MQQVMVRAKRKPANRNGWKTTIRYHIEHGLGLESSSGQLKTWRLTHWDAAKGWISKDAATIHLERRNDEAEKPAYCGINERQVDLVRMYFEENLFVCMGGDVIQLLLIIQWVLLKKMSYLRQASGCTSNSDK